MNLTEIKQEMSWSNWMNLLFVLILVPALLFWAVQSFGIQRKLSEINARRIENCTVLDCKVNMFGSLKCVEKKIGRPNELEFNFSKYGEEGQDIKGVR